MQGGTGTPTGPGTDARGSDAQGERRQVQEWADRTHLCPPLPCPPLHLPHARLPQALAQSRDEAQVHLAREMEARLDIVRQQQEVSIV